MTVGTQPESAKIATDGSGEPVDPIFLQIRDLVYRTSGIFQPEGKLYLLAGGCARRMKELGVRTPREYWGNLTVQAARDGEIRELLNEITIGETCLFRSQPQVDALRKVIVKGLVAEEVRRAVKRVRIWSAGCSTGEEPYTLAISLLEESEGLLKGWKAEIVATDLNDRSIETAKAGIYGEYALRFTSDYFKQKYFVPAGEKKFHVSDEVKKLVTFRRLNLQDNSKILFMKGMDAIFCCNVLIYFDSVSKARVIKHFFSSLNFGGYLFLGTSESLFQLNDQFHLVHFPGTIAYWKPSLKAGRL
jgi:chemotaxis protein methyltransferase CheR